MLRVASIRLVGRQAFPLSIQLSSVFSFNRRTVVLAVATRRGVLTTSMHGVTTSMHGVTTSMHGVTTSMV